MNTHTDDTTQDSALPAGKTSKLLARDWIAGLERGISVIEVFDEEHPRLSASQVGERCGLARTAARRYLLTLEHMGFVATDGKHYWLTPRVMRLGQHYLPVLDWLHTRYTLPTTRANHLAVRKDAA